MRLRQGRLSRDLRAATAQLRGDPGGGRSQNTRRVRRGPGFLYGGGIIPAEMVRELAKSAKLQPITTPVSPEPGYTPSRALADFAHARDLTCRAPGCDQPATQCDIDHTVPCVDGGATHPSNLKCLCRKHPVLMTIYTGPEVAA